MNGPTLDAALYYAGKGWRVIPLETVTNGACSCWRGAACRTPGKHPMFKTGEEHAAGTIDRDLLREWFTRWPDANVGIVTGAASGLVVLDADANKGGLESLAALFSDGLPLTPRVHTGGGGMHLYFKHPGTPVPCRTGFRPGLDLKADGGLVVAPPSVHKSGRSYEFPGTDAA